MTIIINFWKIGPVLGSKYHWIRIKLFNVFFAGRAQFSISPLNKTTLLSHNLSNCFLNPFRFCASTISSGRLFHGSVTLYLNEYLCTFFFDYCVLVQYSPVAGTYFIQNSTKSCAFFAAY